MDAPQKFSLYPITRLGGGHVEFVTWGVGTGFECCFGLIRAHKDIQFKIRVFGDATLGRLITSRNGVTSQKVGIVSSTAERTPEPLYEIDSYIPVFLNRRAAAPVPGPGINYTGPREVLLDFVILVF